MSSPKINFFKIHNKPPYSIHESKLLILLFPTIQSVDHPFSSLSLSISLLDGHIFVFCVFVCLCVCLCVCVCVSVCVCVCLNCYSYQKQFTINFERINFFSASFQSIEHRQMWIRWLEQKSDKRTNSKSLFHQM